MGLSYLALELIASGHDVRVLSRQDRPARPDGVEVRDGRVPQAVGAAILVAVMQRWGFTEAVVSETDILDGLAYRMVEQDSAR